MGPKSQRAHASDRHSAIPPSARQSHTLQAPQAHTPSTRGDLLPSFPPQHHRSILYTGSPPEVAVFNPLSRPRITLIAAAASHAGRRMRRLTVKGMPAYCLPPCAWRRCPSVLAGQFHFSGQMIGTAFSSQPEMGPKSSHKGSPACSRCSAGQLRCRICNSCRRPQESLQAQAATIPGQQSLFFTPLSAADWACLHTAPRPRARRRQCSAHRW